MFPLRRLSALLFVECPAFLPVSFWGLQIHYTGFAKKSMTGAGRSSWSYPKYWMVLQ
jgi:hypothetical protein